MFAGLRPGSVTAATTSPDHPDIRWAAQCGILSGLAVAARATPVAATRERHLGGVHAPKRRR
jgi:hypothetical protein